MQHLDEGTIHAWLDGALPTSEQTLIEQHVRECAECAVLVADARGLIAGTSRIISALDGVPGGVIPTKRQMAAAKPKSGSAWRSLRLTPLRAGLAATLLIAAASTFAVRHGTTGSVVDSVLMRRSVADVPAAAPAVAAKASPTVAATPAVAPSVSSAPQPSPSVQARDRSAAVGATDAMSRNAENREAAKIQAPAPRRERPMLQPSEAVVASSPPLPSPPLQNAAASEAKAVGALSRAKLDSATQDARAGDSALASRGAAAGMRSAFTSTSKPAALLDAVTTSSFNSPSGPFLGCYRIVTDSVRPFRLMPDRFGLDQIEPLSPTSNVVRAIGSGGIMDSVLTTATWQATNRGSATVTWTFGREREDLHLIAAANGLTAQAMVGGRSQPVRITKVGCPR